ncbi:hypothetical protein [Microbacterium laevaniformans]|nr:hypothetical protein [Microbacterium laevaniformans]
MQIAAACTMLVPSPFGRRASGEAMDQQASEKGDVDIESQSLRVREVPAASTGVRLHTRDALLAWEARISDASRKGTPSALDWFLALEALSDSSLSAERRRVVRASQVARALGITDAPVRKGGAVYSSYDKLWAALRDDDLRDPIAREADLLTRLYRQARMATFLRYRGGLVRHLAAIPFSAEAALHAYCRVVIEWSIRWRGVTRSTPQERRSARATTAAARLQQAVALPLIVPEDLAGLLMAVRVEDRDPMDHTVSGGLEGMALSAGVALLSEQLCFALTCVVADPSVTALTASNIVRGHANELLGGALQRMAVRDDIRQQILIDALADFRQMFGAATERGRVISMARAEMERTYQALRVAWGVFGPVSAHGADE